MATIYYLTTGKKYFVDVFNSNNFIENKGHLYNITKKKPKDLGMILYKEENQYGSESSRDIF